MKFYASSKVDNLQVYIPGVTQSKCPRNLCCSPAREGGELGANTHLIWCMHMYLMDAWSVYPRFWQICHTDCMQPICWGLTACCCAAWAAGAWVYSMPIACFLLYFRPCSHWTICTLLTEHRSATGLWVMGWGWLHKSPLDCKNRVKRQGFECTFVI